MSTAAPPPGSRPRWVLRDLADAGWSLLSTAAGLGLGIGLVDGVDATGPLPVLVAAVLVSVVDAALRPVLRWLAVLGSAVWALVLGLTTQIVGITAVLSLVPQITTTGWLPSVLVLVVASAVMAAGRWLIGAADSSYVLGHVLRRARAHTGTRRVAVADLNRPEGLLVVQLDGVARTVLERAIEAGHAPTVARWVDHGSHVIGGWWAQVPSTTPASQAGLLHGDDTQVPAYRWWDRDAERMLVCTRPDDAALIESRMPADGLMSGGGVTISTAFSGGAGTTFLVFSRSGVRAGVGPGPAFVRFFANPFIFFRALLLAFGEMVKELYQAHRQQVRDVAPRCARFGAFVFLRAVTNVLQRDLNLALVTEAMVAGVPRIFVDFLDYDEISHYAGPERPETLRALEGVDGVLGLLEQVAKVASRRYRIVLVSDHGQSLGPTFEQREGRDLTELTRDLMGSSAGDTVQSRSGEEYGPVNALLTAALGRRTKGESGMQLGPDRDREHRAVRTDLPELAVTASGNLGMIWFPRVPERADAATIRTRWPRLLPGLLSTASIGIVVVHTADGPVAFGPAGTHALRDGVVEGDDPLAPYGPHAARDLLRVSGLRGCGDLVVLSTVDDRDRVAAFESLVGSHGGLGGLQNDALLVHPTDWVISADLLDDSGGCAQLVGPVAVHHQLRRWAEAEHAGAEHTAPACSP